MGVANFLFRSNQGVCVYSAQSDKTQKYLTVKVFKIKYIHLRTQPISLTFLQNAVDSLQVQKPWSKPKKWKKLCKFHLQFYFIGLLSINYPRATKQGHKSRNSLHHTCDYLKNETFDF